MRNWLFPNSRSAALRALHMVAVVAVLRLRVAELGAEVVPQLR